MDYSALIIPGVFSVVTVVVVGIMGIRSARATSRGAHEPDVPDAWTETRLARSLMFAFQDWGYAQRGGWKGYARRMDALHGEDGAALTPVERAVLESPPPDAIAKP